MARPLSGESWQPVDDEIFVLKQKMKSKFNQLYVYLYEKTQDEREYLEELIWVTRQKFNIETTTQKQKENYKNQWFIPELF